MTSATKRYKELENFILNCLDNSAILYEQKYQSIKIVPQIGRIMYVEKSRMLDIVDITIPHWAGMDDMEIVLAILEQTDLLSFCESHKFSNQYCYSVFLKEK